MKNRNVFDGFNLTFFQLILWDGELVHFTNGTTMPADSEKTALEIIMSPENAEHWLPKTIGNPFWREWLINRIRQAQDQLRPDTFGAPYPQGFGTEGTRYNYRIVAERFWCTALEMYLLCDDNFTVAKRDDWKDYPLVFDWWRNAAINKHYQHVAYVVEGPQNEYTEMEVEFLHLWNNICGDDVWRSEAEHDEIKAAMVEMGSTFAANLHTPQPELFDAFQN